MKADTKLALADFALNRISSDEFVARIGIDPSRDGSFVLSGLEYAMAERAADEVAFLMAVEGRFGAWPEWAAILSELLLEDWHTRHEDIADCLQNIRDPKTVEALFQGAQIRFAYRDYDEAQSLAVRCLWALHDIGTPDAAARLRTLSECNCEIICEQASALLDDLSSRRPGDPIEAYRRHRDGRVHRGGER